jgi:hypothetical protein
MLACAASGDEVTERFQLAEIPALSARYKIAPMRFIIAIRTTVAGRLSALFRRRLIPSCDTKTMPHRSTWMTSTSSSASNSASASGANRVSIRMSYSETTPLFPAYSS